MNRITNFVKKYFLTAFLAIFFIGIFTVKAASPEAPVITKANIIIEGTKISLLVEGKAPKDTEVLLYNNNKFFGATEVVNERFVFSQVNFQSEGKMKFVAVARNSATQEISELSNLVIPVNVEKTIKPVVKQSPVVKQPTETVQPKKIDEIKIEPKKSEEPKTGEISIEAVQEEQPIVKGLEDVYEEKKPEENTEIENTDTLKTLEEILSNEVTNTEGTSTGIVNETKEQLGKIKLNVFIFLIFLAAVIAWIIWVNRELIKEKESENIED